MVRLREPLQRGVWPARLLTLKNKRAMAGASSSNAPPTLITIGETLIVLTLSLLAVSSLCLGTV